MNAGAADLAGALCTSDVEVGGPRGSGHGRELLVDWVRQSGIRHTAGALVLRDGRCGRRAGRPLGRPGHRRARAPVRLATAFGVTDGRISRVLRHPDTPAALAVLGLGPADEVTARRTADLAGVGSVAWRS